jgi:hypothetical protein
MLLNGLNKLVVEEGPDQQVTQELEYLQEVLLVKY